MAGRVLQQVDEDLLEPVMVGPDRLHNLGHPDPHHRLAGQAVRRGADDQGQVTPVALQPQHA